MKTLIVYYSHSTNNARLAHYIQKRLGCDILRIEDKGKRTRFTILLDRLFNRTPAIKKYDVDFELYDNFIFVAPVWASGVATPLKTFLGFERKHIHRFSFITLCGGRPGQLELLKRELSACVQQEPVIVEELWLSDLLPSEKKDDVKLLMNYKPTEADFTRFSDKLDRFLEEYTVPAS
jgi:flavodoxin